MQDNSDRGYGALDSYVFPGGGGELALLQGAANQMLVAPSYEKLRLTQLTRSMLLV
jgi:hypothetical protein